ncbi:MAG: hypothetical protein ACLGXA_06740 [Acidobacteriota bacterium]
MEYSKPEILMAMDATEAIQSSLAKGSDQPDSEGGPLPSTGPAYQADE